MKELPRRRIKVTSSLNAISTDKPGKRVGGVAPPAPLYITGFWTDI
jgi:hypothetical protein